MKKFLVCVSLSIVLGFSLKVMAQASQGCECIDEGVIDHLEGLIHKGVFFSNVSTFNIIEKENMPGKPFRNTEKLYDSCTYTVDVEIKANTCDAESNCQVEQVHAYSDCRLVDGTRWSKYCSSAELAFFGRCAHRRTVHIECRESDRGVKFETWVNLSNPYYFMDEKNPIKIYPAAKSPSFYRGDQN
ncbi:hypothetical protein MRY82_03610 [bacterium]|nr:hypothetical protein [bacterium]